VHAGLQARSVKAKLSPIVDVIVAVGTCLVLDTERVSSSPINSAPAS